jgi:type IV pilus assembly protein PilO
MAPFNLNINLDVVKKMPLKQKLLIVGGVYLLLAVAYYFLVLQSSLEQKGSLQTKLSELQEQVTAKERLAAQKNKYLRELREREESLKMALTKLPDQREIPGLLYAVAQAGRDSGIDFILFEPKVVEKKPPEPVKKPAGKQPKGKETPEKVADEKFYEEIPVRVTVTGSFHSTALFFEKVARLPRIINIEEIAMSEGKDVKGRGRYISTSCMIKTYMFLEKLNEKKADEKK